MKLSDQEIKEWLELASTPDAQQQDSTGDFNNPRFQVRSLLLELIDARKAMHTIADQIKELLK